MKKDTGPRINERIREKEIRVIADDGEQLGTMTPEDAIARAEEVGLDLVEVAPGSRPPVCRIMDYGRYKYEQKKKLGKGKGHAASLKEVKLRPRTDDHDLNFKLKNIRRFLTDGDKVKVTVMYRGREMVHREIGRKQLDRVNELLGNMSTVENPPRMEGRFLSMILVPNKEAIQEELRAAAKAEKEGAASAAPELESAASEAAPAAIDAEPAESAEAAAEPVKPAEAEAESVKPAAAEGE
jgi:translation initiation factor IF-3